MSTWPLTPDALPLLVIAIALVFAVVMTMRAVDRGSNVFINFMFEGVTLGAGIIVAVSLLYRPLFEWITEHSVFLIILASSSILNALKDIVHTIDRSRSAAPKKPQDI